MSGKRGSFRTLHVHLDRAVPRPPTFFCRARRPRSSAGFNFSSSPKRSCRFLICVFTSRISLIAWCSCEMRSVHLRGESANCFCNAPLRRPFVRGSIASAAARSGSFPPRSVSPGNRPASERASRPSPIIKRTRRLDRIVVTQVPGKPVHAFVGRNCFRALRPGRAIPAAARFPFFPCSKVANEFSPVHREYRASLRLSARSSRSNR